MAQWSRLVKNDICEDLCCFHCFSPLLPICSTPPPLMHNRGKRVVRFGWQGFHTWHKVVPLNITPPLKGGIIAQWLDSCFGWRWHLVWFLAFLGKRFFWCPTWTHTPPKKTFSHQLKKSILHKIIAYVFSLFPHFIPLCEPVCCMVLTQLRKKIYFCVQQAYRAGLWDNLVSSA